MEGSLLHTSRVVISLDSGNKTCLTHLTIELIGKQIIFFPICLFKFLCRIPRICACNGESCSFFMWPKQYILLENVSCFI